ncbi:MAG: metallopeptidase family protein [Candidatus Wildermuthbacteria bacterium]|nr:metallopeptidase family protein [Candidatus Wildermuthbacteria bacterium]
MVNISRSKFEELVKEGIAAIPPKFLALLENVATVIEEEPTQEQRKKLGMRRHDTLLGLYEGVPQTSRGPSYSGVLPDKITIFMRPILDSANTKEEIQEVVKETVRHEIAHHFGMNDKELEESEFRRLAKQGQER